MAVPLLDQRALPRIGAVLRRDFYLLGGPAVLVWFLVEGRSPLFAGFWGLVVAFVLSWVRRDTRIGATRALAILADSAQAAMPVALACATVGIVVGVVSTTGLGLKLATGIVGLAGGSLLMTLVLTMVAALVLGTGLPTSATYIITSIMAAPALVELGRYDAAEAPLLEAHRRLTTTDQTHTPAMATVLEALARVCERSNRPKEAAQWRKRRAALQQPASQASGTRPAP